MTISSPALPLSYAGNGSTKAFPITWPYIAKSHVVATLRSSTGVETVQVLATNYTLTKPGATGTLTMIVAPASGETLIITSEPPNTQGTDLPFGGPFPAKSVEDALDLAAQVSQKIDSKFDRALRVPKTDTLSGDDLEIPNETDRASKFLAFGVDGKPVVTAVAPVGGAVISTFAETYLDDTDAKTTRATLGAAADNQPGQNIKNQGISFSVNANALTASVKTSAGLDATATEKIIVPMRSLLITLGTYVMREIVAALSLVISSGSTLGHASAVAGNINWYLIDNAGTLELAASTEFMGLSGIVTTIAEGGAGGADSASVMYSAVARAGVPFLWIAETVDTQTVAGTWAATPTSITLVKEIDVPDASTTVKGLIEFGTIAEAKANVPSTTLGLSIDSYRKGSRVYGPITDISTSEVSYLFATGLPSWITQLIISWEQMSLNSTDQPIIRLGDSGGVEDSDYFCKSSSFGTGVGTSTLTTGFVLRTFAAANIVSGKMVLDLLDPITNLWIQDHNFAFENTTVGAMGSGRKALSGTLTQLLLITVNGTNTFDGSNSRITYSYT